MTERPVSMPVLEPIPGATGDRGRTTGPARPVRPGVGRRHRRQRRQREVGLPASPASCSPPVQTGRCTSSTGGAPRCWAAPPCVGSPRSPGRSTSSRSACRRRGSSQRWPMPSQSGRAPSSPSPRGCGESSVQGRAIEREALGLVRAAGAVLVGPNCLGVVDTTTRLQLSSDPFTAGSVAVLSARAATSPWTSPTCSRAPGLGVSRFVSLGNQADLTLVELVRDCVGHEGTRAVAVYAEDVRDGRGFAEAAREAARGGEAGGAAGAGAHRRGEPRRRLAHRVADQPEPCRRRGVRRRVGTPRGHTRRDGRPAGGAGPAPPRPGRRVAVLTDGGGHGAVAADAVSACGLDVPLLSAGLGDPAARGPVGAIARSPTRSTSPGRASRTR